MTVDYDKINSFTERRVTVLGLKDRESRKCPYRSGSYRLEALIVTLTTSDDPVRISVTFRGPVLRKDGSDSKSTTEEHFWNLTKVPTWVWDLLDRAGELSSDARQTLRNQQIERVGPGSSWAHTG